MAKIERNGDAPSILAASLKELSIEEEGNAGKIYESYISFLFSHHK